MKLPFLAAVLLATACANQSQRAPTVPAAPEAAAAAPSRPLPSDHRMQPPFVLKLEGPKLVDPGAKVEVIAAIDRTGWLEAPIDLEVVAGEGIEILSGKPHERIEDPESRQIVRRFGLVVSDPASAFEVHARISGEGYGANATKRLTFDGGAQDPKPRPRPGELLQPR